MAYTLSRDAGPGVYTVRSSNRALGRIVVETGDYCATAFPKPAVFEGTDLGGFPTRQSAAIAICIMKAINDAHDEGYLSVAMDGFLVRLPRYVGHSLLWSRNVLPVLQTLIERGHVTDLGKAFAVTTRFDRAEYDRRVQAAATYSGGW